jgi:hypothetical protein
LDTLFLGVDSEGLDADGCKEQQMDGSHPLAFGSEGAGDYPRAMSIHFRPHPDL